MMRTPVSLKHRKAIPAFVMLILGALVLFALPVFAKQGTITVVASSHWNFTEWVRAAANRYEELNPNVKVDVITGASSQMQVMVAGGTPPDVIHVPGNLPQLLGPHLLYPLDDFIERDKEISAGFIPQTWNAMKWQGQQMAVPNDWFVQGMNYNIDLFNERGVSLPGDDWTWDDLLVIAKKMTFDKSGDGETDVFGYGDSYGHFNVWPSWVWGAGGSVWNEEMTRTLVDSPESLVGLRFQYELYFEHKVGPRMVGNDFADPGATTTSRSDTAWTELFQSGRLAMRVGSRQAVEGFEVAVGSLARGPAGRRDTVIVPNGWGICSAAKHKPEAWEFIKFLTSEEGYQIGATMEPVPYAHQASIPARTNLAVKLLSQSPNPREKAWVDVVVDGRANPTRHPLIEGTSTTLVTMVRGFRQAVARGEVSLDNYVKDYARRINAAMEEVLNK